MKTIDALISKLKETKEELSKNMNASYGSSSSNMSPAGMDSMAMSEAEPHKDDPHHEAKEKAKAKKIKEKAEELIDMHKGSLEKGLHLRGGASSDADKQAAARESNQKKKNLLDLERLQDMHDKLPDGHPNKPKIAANIKRLEGMKKEESMDKADKQSHSVFSMEHSHQVLAMPHDKAKEHLHAVVDASSANPGNKSKIKAAINSSRGVKDLSHMVYNHILAAGGPGVGKKGDLKVLKFDDDDRIPMEKMCMHKNGQWEIEKAEGKKTKHDRCAEEVGKDPSISNPHAVCVASGVKPDKWSK